MPFLEVHGLTKRFQNVLALQAVDDQLGLQVVPPDTSLLRGVERAR